MFVKKGTDLSCYTDTEKTLLHQNWENSLSRALAYCLTLGTIYIVLLGFIIIYETYQVHNHYVILTLSGSHIVS